MYKHRIELTLIDSETNMVHKDLYGKTLESYLMEDGTIALPISFIKMIRTMFPSSSLREAKTFMDNLQHFLKVHMRTLKEDSDAYVREQISSSLTHLRGSDLRDVKMFIHKLQSQE